MVLSVLFQDTCICEFFLFKFLQNWGDILNSVLNPTFKNEHYYENLFLVFIDFLNKMYWGDTG